MNEPDLVWVQRGRPRTVFAFTIACGKIVEIDLLADPDRLAQLDLAILNDRSESAGRRLKLGPDPR